MNRRRLDAPSLRIGVLGGAHITREALIRPSAAIRGVDVTAVAGRDPDRTSRYASQHRIPRVLPSYRALLEDPAIDAVYIPLPAALHATWTLEAVAAGKHVLCEKPFASNAPAAQEVADVAAGSDVVVMEAYHSGHHPLLGRLREILASGELGRIEHAAAWACAPIPPGRDIRWDLDLGGGAMLDVGYYPLRLLRDLFGDVDQLTAVARSRHGVDGRMDVRMLHATGVRSEVVASLWSWPLVAMRLDVRGSAGRMRVGTPYHPQMRGKIRVTGRNGSRVEHPDRRPTYEFQLEAFRDAVLEGRPVTTGPPEAATHLEVIDRLYRSAGLEPRPSASSGRG